MKKNTTSAQNGKLGGRPLGAKNLSTLQKEAVRSYLIKAVEKEIEPIVQGHIELAKGIWMEEIDEKGNPIKIYRKAPNQQAAEYLIDQAAGRASQAVDITSNGESVATTTPEALKLAKEYEKQLKNK